MVTSNEKQLKTNKFKQKLEECEPGTIKSEVFEVLRIIATTKAKPKSAPKKKP